MTYSPDGDVVSVTVTESRFTPDEVTVLLASRRAEQERRGAHGHPLSESTSRDADPSSFDAKYRYRVPSPTVDYAARALAQAQAERRKAYPNEDQSALLWRVVRDDL